MQFEDHLVAGFRAQGLGFRAQGLGFTAWLHLAEPLAICSEGYSSLSGLVIPLHPRLFFARPCSPFECEGTAPHFAGSWGLVSSYLIEL